MTQFLEDGTEDTYEVSVKNSSDLFSFKKEKEHTDPFGIGIDDLKKVIMEVGGKYWADNWALVTLERIYKVKFIVLSQDHFLNGEKELVLQCSEADKKLQAQGIFEPSYYIIVDYIKGVHYYFVFASYTADDVYIFRNKKEGYEVLGSNKVLFKDKPVEF